MKIVYPLFLAALLLMSIGAVSAQESSDATNTVLVPSKQTIHYNAPGSNVIYQKIVYHYPSGSSMKRHHQRMKSWNHCQMDRCPYASKKWDRRSKGKKVLKGVLALALIGLVVLAVRRMRSKNKGNKRRRRR